MINNEYVALWMQKHQHIISFLKARFDTKTFSGLTLSILTLAFVYILALFAGVVEDLITYDPIVAVDIRIATLVAVFRTDALTNLFIWITLLGNSQVILCFITVTVILLWLWRKNYYILPLFIVVAGSEAFTFLGKLAFHRHRPQMAVYTEQYFSFPSGHATIAVAFYGFIAYILMHFVKSWNKKVNIFFATIFIIIAIGLSRIYLGVHYISDVWGGYLVGAMWLIIAISFSEWLGYKEKSVESRPLFNRTRMISFILILSSILFYVKFSINYNPSLPPAPLNNSVIVSKSTDIFTKEQMKYTETLIILEK